MIEPGSKVFKFIRFHQDNPHIYTKIRRACKDLWKAGVHKASIKLIFEHLRWNHLIEQGKDDFPINNNYHAYYARVIMAANPRFVGFFDVRVQQEGDWIPDLALLGIGPDGRLLPPGGAGREGTP
jgi:hypothetical protein